MGTVVHLRLDVQDVGSAKVSLLTFDEQQTATLPMTRCDDCFTIDLPTPNAPVRLGYCFCIEADGQTRYYGAASGVGALSDTPVFYGVTLYDGAFTTPAWFRHALVYQIFPDRFACSDRGAFSQRAAAYRDGGRSLVVQEWDAQPLYLPHGGNPDYAPDDYFGGDLKGILQKLPYLASLGVTCLYLNPIFAAHSNHRYNTADYLTIDPLLGTNDDFEALAKGAAARGMRLLLDGVFSHTGDDSIYFDRYGRYGNGACQSKDSPYYPWYRFTDYPSRYECWWNFQTLPNVDELEPSYTAFIQGEHGVLRTWLRRGASGWRLDVADELPDAFLYGLRRALKAQDADAVLLGEVWDNCATKTGEQGRRTYVNGASLDSAMNYPFRDAVVAYLTRRIDAYAFAQQLAVLREDYPKPFFDACLNLIGSHDVERIRTALTGAPDARTLTREQQLDYAPSDADWALATARYLAATALQMCFPGVPCLYYGDEVGISGMRDPFNRTTFPWENGDDALLASVRQLTALRQEKVMQAGCTRMGAIGQNTFALVRYTQSACVILLLNSGHEADAVLYPALLLEGPDGNTPIPFAGVYRGLDGACHTADATLSVRMPANSFAVLRRVES